MDLLDILRACLRRWYVFFPIAGLSAYLAMSSYSSAQPQYSANTSVLVVPSKELIVARGAQGMGGAPVTTPFNGGGGASSLAGLLTNALNTSTVREQLLPGGGALISASRDTTSDSEFVSVTVVATSEQRASAALGSLTTGVNQVLSGIQTTAGAPQGQLYVAAPGGPVDPPTVDYPDRLRGMVGVGLAGILAAVVLSVLVHALASGGSRRPVTSARRPVPQPQRGRDSGSTPPPRQSRPEEALPWFDEHQGVAGQDRRPSTVDLRSRRSSPST